MIQFLLCVTVLPVLPGLTLIRLKKEKETTTLTECYMMGLLFLFLLGEAVSCAVIKLEGSFSLYCRIFGSAVMLCSFLSLLLNWRMAGKLRHFAHGAFLQKKEKKKKPVRQKAELAVLLLLLVLQFAGYVIYTADTGSDTMTETILATTVTDTVFQYNPVTGAALSYGMYPVYKLASLSLLYSALYRMCGMPLPVFLYYAVPFWLLLVSFCVLSLLSKAFFGEQQEKRNLFLIFMNLLILTGDGESSAYAYNLLHGGWKGPTAAAALIVPFGVYILYTMFDRKEWRYGIAGLLLTVCGLLFARPLFLPDSLAFTESDTGRQWGLLVLTVLALYMARDVTKKKWKRQEAVLLAGCLLSGIISGSALVLIGTAYAGACIWGIAEEWKKGVPVFAGSLILICLAGTVLPYQADIVKKWHVSEADEAVQDKITILAENYKEGAKLAAPENVMEQAKLRNGRIILPYGKDLWYENCNREIADVYTDAALILYEQMKTDYMQPDTIAAMAAEQQCDILVMREAMSSEAEVQYGWKKTEGTAGYAVYCR